MECLERSAVTPDLAEKENLAREAFNFLSKVPESADLQTVCKRFEDLRSVVRAIGNLFSFQLFFRSSHHKT